MFYSFKPIRAGTYWFSRVQYVLLIQTNSGWFLLVQAGCKMFYSFKPIQVWLIMVQAGCKMFFSFNPILVNTGSGRMQDVLLIQTYSGSYWFRKGARCFTHSNLFRLVQTGSGRLQDVLLIQTCSD
jgi:hypothetical protein